MSEGLTCRCVWSNKIGMCGAPAKSYIDSNGNTVSLCDECAPYFGNFIEQSGTEIIDE